MTNQNSRRMKCQITHFNQTIHQKIKDNLLVIYYLDRDN